MGLGLSLLAACWMFSTTQNANTRVTYADDQAACESKRKAHIEQACRRPGVLVEQCLEDMPVTIECKPCSQEDENAR